MILIILKFVLLMVFGVSFTAAIKFKGGWLERLGLSFLLGTGTLSVIYFLFTWITNRVIATDFWIMTFALTSLLLILSRPKLVFKRIIFSKTDIKLNLIPIICWSIMGILFITSLINTSYNPAYTTDSLILFDFRAKVMFLSQKLSLIQIINGWDGYPMFTSMIGLISRFVGIDSQSLYYPLMYFSFTLVFYSILRKSISRNLASIGTFLMYTTPITLWQSQLDGMTNIPYAIFLCLSIFYIYKILFNKKPFLYDVIISAVFLGLSSWTRGIEPLWVTPLFSVILISIAKKKYFIPFIYFAIFYPIRELWPMYVGRQYTTIARAGRIITDAFSQRFVGRPTLYELLLHILKSVYALIYTNIGPVLGLFIFFLVLDILFFKKIKGQIYYLFTVSSLLIILFVGSIYMAINFNFEVNDINGSFSRLLSIFPPLMWFCIMISPTWGFVINKLKLKNLFNRNIT